MYWRGTLQSANEGGNPSALIREENVARLTRETETTKTCAPNKATRHCATTRGLPDTDGRKVLVTEALNSPLPLDFVNF